MSPPPLPWSVRTAPERLILLSGAATLLAAALLAALQQVGCSPACLWKSFTGFPCAGCGGTRAIAMLLHGDAGSALAMNPAVVVAVAGAFPVFGYALTVVAFRLEPWRPAFLPPRVMRFFFAAGLLANWLFVILAGRV